MTQLDRSRRSFLRTSAALAGAAPLIAGWLRAGSNEAGGPLIAYVGTICVVAIEEYVEPAPEDVPVTCAAPTSGNAGTGYGREQVDRVQRVDFRPSNSYCVVTLNYEVGQHRDPASQDGYSVPPPPGWNGRLD